jgi:UDP-4-amino-4,6-dideoxy-N-acetyl-beta-L-altrosamine N-acetyltransferase
MSVEQMSRVSLRLMMEADLPLALAWRNHPEIRRYMYSQAEISLTEHAAWFKSISRNPSRVLLIFEVDGVPVGYANFRLYEGGEADWGFYAAPDAPKGTGRLMGEAITEYAFSVLGLEKICGEVLETNVPSQRFHLRHGFELVTDFQGKSKTPQSANNIYRYVLTRKTWQARKGKN